MPRMTGYELCRRIRSDEALKMLRSSYERQGGQIRQQFVEQRGRSTPSANRSTRARCWPWSRARCRSRARARRRPRRDDREGPRPPSARGRARDASTRRTSAPRPRRAREDGRRRRARAGAHKWGISRKTTRCSPGARTPFRWAKCCRCCRAAAAKRNALPARSRLEVSVAFRDGSWTSHARAASPTSFASAATFASRDASRGRSRAVAGRGEGAGKLLATSPSSSR